MSKNLVKLALGMAKQNQYGCYLSFYLRVEVQSEGEMFRNYDKNKAIYIRPQANFVDGKIRQSFIE